MSTAHLGDFYREVARVALSVADRYGFVLGGGVAWAAHGLVNRPTEDLDLFADVDGAAGAAATEVRTVLQAAGFDVRDEDPAGDLASLFDGFDQDMKDFVVSRGGRQLRLTLGRLDRHRSPVVMDLGPVMHVQDLVASKTVALITRREVRDYIDIAAALDVYRLDELLALAHDYDPALDPEDIRAAGHYLDRLPDRRFARYGLTPDEVRIVHQRLADWPR
ncbi:nucleotidyl transferase AbiEii/AbiGii toxin family protein [Micromonospora sp. NBC_01796]|uniref:nucleotidyl transferase AbiEii/AbiGii toxin family protein n=1 Tax=Micromonospora sp. NBC_01796 TaxID=2975987 RepID=UPI002DDAFA18|nr:nucleotidyl transferase AbiEii/AbiGii toxin family protein [Micromonospora sp. NBC_01796]WSA84953.1 nucleotidyl transferase AbiEii/AbiGii toxin family protein [Micromonospora sp. NBC_01796]